MKKLVLVASILAGTTVAASAADMAPRYYSKAPPPLVAPIYNWGGFYVGVNGGWGSSHNCYTATAILAVPIVHLGEGCHDSSGGTVGGQVGYRWQAGPWVFGLEAQGNWADLTGSTPNLALAGATLSSKMDAFGLFTGQVGYAWNNVLLYAKGGAAVTDRNFWFNAPGGALASSTGYDTRWSPTVGAGLEFGFYQNWSVGIEYNHIFEDHHGATFVTTGGVAFPGFNTGGDTDMVLGKLNYRWGGPVIAKY
jgi:outer membrane immunogenic protein